MTTKLPDEIIEFQPDALEIKNERLPLWIRLCVWLPPALVLIVILWASCSRVDVVVQANGKLVTDRPTIVMKPLERSVIKEINVKIGDVVKPDQILITFDPALNRAEEERLKNELDTLSAQFDRLRAEFDGKTYRDSGKNQFEKWQYAIYRQRQEYYTERINYFNAMLSQVAASIKSKKDSLAKQQERLAAEMAGVGGAVGRGRVAEAFLAAEAGLGDDARADAAEQALPEGDAEVAGECLGEKGRLVVTAGAELGGLHGDGDDGVEAQAKGGDAGDVGGGKEADEVFLQPDAAVILEGVDEMPEGAVVAGHDEGAGEGGAAAEAVRADEVGPAGHGRLRAADKARGVTGEGEAPQTVGADVAALAGGAFAEDAVARVDEVERPAQEPPRRHKETPKHRSPSPSAPPSRMSATAPRRTHCVRAKSPIASAAESQRNPAPPPGRSVCPRSVHAAAPISPTTTGLAPSSAARMAQWRMA